jgi:hypothetical protein
MRFIIIVFVFFISSCKIETAGPDYQADLIIASNFLKEQDTLYYRGFEKKTGINIKIRSLSADSIQQILKSKGYNSKIDLVFLKSITDIKDFQVGFFHEFQYNYAKNKLTFFKPIMNNKWLVAGIDPYVFSYIKDSTERPTNYNQLTAGYLWATPNEENLDVFLAHVKYNLRKNKKFGFKQWNQKFKRNQVLYDNGTDSVASIQFLLSKESDIISDSRLSKQQKRILSYPNGGSTCPYADRYCIALVNQSVNFYNGKRLLKYIQLCGRIPASYKIKPYPKKQEERKCLLSERAILSMLKNNKE